MLQHSKQSKSGMAADSPHHDKPSLQGPSAGKDWLFGGSFLCNNALTSSSLILVSEVLTHCSTRIRAIRNIIRELGHDRRLGACWIPHVGTTMPCSVYELESYVSPENSGHGLETTSQYTHPSITFQFVCLGIIVLVLRMMEPSPNMPDRIRSCKTVKGETSSIC